MSSHSLELTHVGAAMRVLVVDDDDAIRAVLTEVLQEEGFEVVGRAIDGIEGVSLALSLSPDGVLLDVRMPRMGGIEAARAILAQLPHVRIVMLSAYDDASLQAEAKEAGVDAFLVKGCPLGELVAAVSVVPASEGAAGRGGANA